MYIKDQELGIPIDSKFHFFGGSGTQLGIQINSTLKPQKVILKHPPLPIAELLRIENSELDFIQIKRHSEPPPPPSFSLMKSLYTVKSRIRYSNRLEFELIKTWGEEEEQAEEGVWWGGGGPRRPPQFSRLENSE